MAKFLKIGTIMVLVLVMVALIPADDVSANWTYTVQSGDTLWNIARQHGTTVYGIQRASNHWSNNIRPGQRLEIPSGEASSSRTGNLSQSEVELIARLVQAEAEGEPYNGKVGVAAVVLNRVESSEFPNTVSGVIYEPHAFESVTNNLIWQRSPGRQALNAVREAQNGRDPTNGSLFFWNPYKPVTPWIWSRTIITQYGDHVFGV